MNPTEKQAQGPAHGMIPLSGYDILEKVKLQGQKSDEWLPRPEGEKKGLATKGHEDILRKQSIA